MNQNKMIMFEIDLEKLINEHSIDNDLNTPDYILADYLVNCLENYRKITEERENWHQLPSPKNQVRVPTEITETWEDVRARCS